MEIYHKRNGAVRVSSYERKFKMKLTIETKQGEVLNRVWYKIRDMYPRQGLEVGKTRFDRPFSTVSVKAPNA